MYTLYTPAPSGSQSLIRYLPIRGRYLWAKAKLWPRKTKRHIVRWLMKREIQTWKCELKEIEIERGRRWNEVSMLKCQQWRGLRNTKQGKRKQKIEWRQEELRHQFGMIRYLNGREDVLKKLCAWLGES